MPVGLVKLRKQNSEPKQTHKDKRIFRVGSEKQKKPHNGRVTSRSNRSRGGISSDLQKVFQKLIRH